MTSQDKSTKVKGIPPEASPEQIKWVLARLTVKTDQAAAKEAGVNPSTVSRWDLKPQLDQAVKDLLTEPVQAALAILSDAGALAAQVMVDELDSRKNKLAAAREVLDRIGASAKRQVDITSDDKPLILRVSGFDNV